MTNIKKFEDDEIIPTPAQMMIEDGITKKKAIYHQPPNGKTNYAAEKARYNELCSDAYKITLGYPMSWTEFNQISDSLRKEYIESMMDKYPGISYNTLACMFNVNTHIVKFEVNRLGICINGRVGSNVLSVYKQEIDEIKAKIKSGEKPRNLQIVRKEDLSKLKRKHYKEVKAMDPEDALKYINGIYARYSKTLSVGDFSDMMGCSKSSTSILFKEIGFKFNNVNINFCNSKEAKIIRAKFREEMIENGGKKFIKRKYNKSKKDEDPIAETVEPVVSETVETVADPEPADDKIMVETRFVPMAEVPMVEFYDPASVMDGCIPADREIEDVDPVEEHVSDNEPIKHEFNITSIDAEVDVDKIDDLIKHIGFTGKVKIHIEKI